MRTERYTLPVLTPSPGYSLAGREDLQTLNERGHKILQSRHKYRVTQREMPTQSPGMRPCLPAHFILALCYSEPWYKSDNTKSWALTCCLLGWDWQTPVRTGWCYPGKLLQVLPVSGISRATTGFMTLPKGSVAQSQLRTSALDKLKDTCTRRFIGEHSQHHCS